jgi:hypothetical protein
MSRRLGRLTRVTVGGAIVLAPLPSGGDIRAQEVHGPLAIRNQSPIQLLFFQFVPERAVPLGYRQARLRVDIAETNTLTADEEGRDGLTGKLDLEMTYANLQARIGLGEGLEVGVDLPIIAMHGEFMDGFIDWFERLIDYERGPRAEERREHMENEFTYRVSRDGETILEGIRNRVGVGDVAIQAKWAPPNLRETASTPGVALRLAFKIPSGDPDAALGSGRPDIGVGLALEKTWGRWSLYGNLNGTFPIGNRFAEDDLTVQPIFSALLGMEYRFSPKLALVGQLSANSPPFRNTGLNFLDGWSDWAALGLSWAPTPAWQLQIGDHRKPHHLGRRRGRLRLPPLCRVPILSLIRAPCDLHRSRIPLVKRGRTG